MYGKTSESNCFGVDVADGKVKNVADEFILDCWENKSWALKLCIDACLTILKVD